MRWLAAGLALAVLVAGGLAAAYLASGPRAVEVAPITRSRTEAYSNIYREDYVGPDACQRCHRKRYAGWQGGLHRTMNRPVVDDPRAVVGDFSGAILHYANGRAVFERVGDEFFMSLARAGEPLRRYRVTRTIGSRYLQEYVGVPTLAEDATEIRLPFGYWLRKRAWFPRQYFDSWFPAEYDGDGKLATDAYQVDSEPWDSRCAWCHNTYAFELRALRARESLLGQGREQYFRLLTSRRAPADQKRVAKESRLPTDELVTVGISCESCHLGGREHVRHDEEIRFDPVSRDLQPIEGAPDLAGGRQNSVLINTVCAQCHSTPAPRHAHGGVKRNSSEALDMAAGACMSAIKCTDCHDPHERGARAGEHDETRYVAACVGCHKSLAKQEAAQAHAGHDTHSASCLDCHMPQIVLGISQVVRSHRISSPTNETMIAQGAPNACNLCHLDRSIGWAVNAIEDTHNWRVIARRSWREHYGPDLARPVGEAWLASPDPATRVIAAWAYARAKNRAALPKLLQMLDDPIAYYRMFTLFAVEDLLGRQILPSEYAATGDPDQRHKQVNRLLRDGVELVP